MAGQGAPGFEIGTDGPTSILVGLDATRIKQPGPQPTMHAAAYAAGLARRQGARLVVIWVRPRVAYADTMAETADEIARSRTAAVAEAQGNLEWAAEHYGIPASALVVRDGDPFEEITGVAEAERADAIVVGASEHRLGSLAVRLVRDARWPVIVVP